MRSLLLFLLLIGVATAADERPNILFCIADDWGWPHAGAYGDKVVKTPNFDRIAKEGALFGHAYVSSPSCTPSRAAILTGQFHWRLEESANLWSSLRKEFDAYPDLLEAAGYHVGHSRKGWGPGRNEPGGRSRNPAGDRYKNFGEFLAKRPEGKPFCFWFGSNDPHRGFKEGSGAEAGVPLDKIEVPEFYPDTPGVRGDIADYYLEVQRFDREVGERMEMLRESGELDNTIVVMTGDHGMPFPRCKANLYDMGARVPLALRWPAKAKAATEIGSFVSLTDIAPTFLDLAGLPVPEKMTGKSLLPLLAGKPGREYLIYGKDRHVACQEKPISGGYPSRAIRTKEFLLIRNFKPDRWPAGTPNTENAFLMGSWYGDCDPGPTRNVIVRNRGTADGKKFYNWCFAKRPEFELFAVADDPFQLKNLADEPAFAKKRARLWKMIEKDLRASDDPLIVGGYERLENYPYYGGTPTKKGFKDGIQ